MGQKLNPGDRRVLSFEFAMEAKSWADKMRAGKGIKEIRDEKNANDLYRAGNMMRWHSDKGNDVDVDYECIKDGARTMKAIRDKRVEGEKYTPNMNDADSVHLAARELYLAMVRKYDKLKGTVPADDNWHAVKVQADQVFA